MKCFAIVSLIAGVLILIVPRLLNYIVAIILIVCGVIGLGRRSSRVSRDPLRRKRPSAPAAPAVSTFCGSPETRYLGTRISGSRGRNSPPQEKP